MIVFLEGTVAFQKPDSIALNVNGVGYEVFVRQPYGYEIGEAVLLYTYQQFREDAVSLYGFLHQAELELFKKLIDVKGIGCKSAMNMLASMDQARIMEAIENEDIKTLKSLPGIGPKAASQIILDLKGKLASIKKEELKEESISPLWKETQQALEALGYNPDSLGWLREVLENDPNADTASSMLKQALVLIAKRKGV